MEILKREIYFKRILPFIKTNLIKIITGQRRVGKSYFLKQIIKILKEDSTFQQIIYINKEDFAYDAIKNYSDLIRFVENENKSNYCALFIDEIQEIKDFEKALRHFQTKETYDIYCTGSNAKMLSGDLATLLSGRSIEIEIYSLIYSEFLVFHNLPDNQESFDKYILFGGMPNLVHLNLQEEIVFDYLRNLYNTIIVKDVISRYSIRNISFLKNLVVFVSDNIGSIISAKKVSEYLKSQQINISQSLVQDYLLYLNDAYFIHKVSRSDLQGKKIFEIGEKYFFNDLGLRNSLKGYNVSEISKILENVVYLHLKVAGFTITVGIDRTKEIDFIAQKKGEFIYIQVCYLLNEQKTIEREFGNLKKISNSYPKMVISMDKTSNSTYDGIKHLHILDFCKIVLNL